MSITPTTLVSPQAMTATTQTYYTSTNIKTRIDKATFTNTDNSNSHSVTIYIVPTGGSATGSTMITNAHSLAPGETWNCPDLIGQIMAAGSTLQALGATTLTISVAGVLIS